MMGVFQQHAAIIMVHGPNEPAQEAFERVRQYADHLSRENSIISEAWNALLVGPVDTITNFCQVYALLPDGSKEGWATSDRGDDLRSKFIEEMGHFGEVVEVSWGEMGVRVATFPW